jgi:hypothetical protein
MGVCTAYGTAYTCLHTSKVRPALCTSVCPSHANDNTSYCCSDNHQWILNAQLDPPSSPCDTVVHKVALGYVRPTVWAEDFLCVSPKSALNLTKTFTSKCINYSYPAAQFPFFQSNIHNQSSFYSINFNDKYTIIYS